MPQSSASPLVGRTGGGGRHFSPRKRPALLNASAPTWPLSRGRQAAAGAALVMLAAVLTFTTAYGDGRASSDAMPVTAGGAPVLSFAIASSAALDGELMAGEVVDLVVPDASVPVTGARVAIDDAEVLRVTERDQMVTLTVAVRDESAAGAVVGALSVPGVTVVRNARPVS